MPLREARSSFRRDRRFFVPGAINDPVYIPEFDTRSIQFNNNENMKKLNSSLGIDSQWTFMIWFYNEALAINDWIADFQGSTSSKNRMTFFTQSAGATGSMRLEVYDSTATVQKRRTYTAGFPDGWHQFVVVFDDTVAAASQLVTYKNGSPLAGTINLDGDCQQDSDVEDIATASASAGSGGWTGRVHSIALWDDLLSAAEVSAIYNSGDAHDFELDSDSGSYTSSADLVHWWRLGLNKIDIGGDYAGALDLMDNAVNIDQTDISFTYPGEP